MSFVRNILRLNVKLLLAVLLLPAAGSCVREEAPADEVSGDADGSIVVSATVAAGRNTRAYMDDEPSEVVEGTYYMLYYKKTGTNGSYYKSDAYVDFGYNGTTEDPATGFVYYLDEDGETRKDLKWRHIYGEGQSAQTFYLSNLSPDSYTYHASSTSSYWYHFKPKNPNPYVSSPLDQDQGTNDLLVGSASAKVGQKIEFRLNHLLALLKINIEVYPSTDNQNHYVNLENAKVSISNLATDVIDINFRYPTVYKYSSSTSVSPGYSDNYGRYTNIRKDDDPILLVNPADGPAKDANPDAPVYDWDEGLKGKEMDGYLLYSTQPFIMPPQTIPPTTSTATNVINRPRLVVEVPTDQATGAPGATGTTTYSGYIPTVMFDVDDEGNILTDSAPEDIALRSGYQLTITATINSPNLELIFTPVKIERWVNKGNYTFRLKQAGIYNANDFDNLIRTYNALMASNDPNWTLLERFGYVDETGHLVIQMWASVELDIDKISGSMAALPGVDVPEFSFVFNGYTLTLTEQVPGAEKPREIGELYGREGQARLHRIVTDSNYDYRNDKEGKDFAGIDSAEKLKTLIALLNDPTDVKLEEVVKYGAINNTDNTIEFDISDSFEVDLDEIFLKIPESVLGYTCSVTLKNGKQVTVRVPTMPEEGDEASGSTDKVIGGQIECLSSDAINKLLVARASYGIRSAEELYLLIYCYNELYTVYPDLLNVFGSVDRDGKWTFYVRNEITVDGDRVFVSMVPDPENGKPEYATSGSSDITYEHDLIPFSSNSYLYQILSGTGSASSENRLSTIVTSYNKNSYPELWNNGRFDNKRGKWVFPLTYGSRQQYIAYSGLFGMMIRDEAEGKYDYEFVIGGFQDKFEVRSMPNNDGLDQSSNNYRYFLQDGSDDYAYPNSAADLKRVADGTYWEHVNAH